MSQRFELRIKPHLRDPQGRKIQEQWRALQSTPLEAVRTLEVYLFQGQDLEEAKAESLMNATLLDPVLHEGRVNRFFGDEVDFDWYIEVGFRPGVTDNVGRTAQETFEFWLERPLAAGDHVHSLRGYFLKGQTSREAVESFTRQALMNELIERATIIARADWNPQKSSLKTLPNVVLTEAIQIERLEFASVEQVLSLSKQRTLALSREEAEAILDYFSRPEVQKRRQDSGIGLLPTDVELEVLAQTWSEHCKHKIFNADVEYTDSTTGQTQHIRSLYKTYVKGSTAVIRQALGPDDWCVSVFSDNAGVIRFNEDWNIVMKVETHNSPSALDPYGGALTGIVGVNRDSFGTGLGTRLIFNTDVFCFASPFYHDPLPPKLMHPRRIFEGVRLGVEHGGNKSGIPTVNGTIVFHERFLGKPLVFCGTGGLMPRWINGHPTHEKDVKPGDLIVMVGGRIGKDGIHGATFSSEALNESSPVTAVQIGDPIVQKRMFDFLTEARDLGLYRCITDNGAGGLSSSVGEMAQFCNGAHIELEKAPLKYPGLQPWEIFVSEAQERMTLAVAPEHWERYHSLSQAMGVESTVLGTFNNSGLLTASYQGELVAYLDMEFMHDGLPPMQLKAIWQPPQLEEPLLPASTDLGATLKELLGRLNICSKESVVRQYDHEVQGSSVIKPLVGIANDGPSDAAVIRPVLDSMEGLAIANGICPRYSDLDAYHMMTNAIDEAVRNIIAVGGSLKQIAGLDNFCWCDPVASPQNPEGAYKMAQLVRANQALYDLTTLYGVPCISGKDSMKNDYRFGDLHIAIPPTVLFTTVGKLEDVRKAITMDAKTPGDLVYLVGETKHELGGSEYYASLGILGKNVPQVDGPTAKARYEAISEAIANGWLQSCHDCSDGGLAVALAETAFAGGLGMKLDLTAALTQSSLPIEVLLFSESASRFIVTVSPENAVAFEQLLTGQIYCELGSISEDENFVVQARGRELIHESLSALKKAWQATLR